MWGVDITDVRLVKGWMYLVAFLDWFSRYVVAWELSDTLEMDFVLLCAEAALAVDKQRYPRLSTPIKAATSPVSALPSAS